MKISIIVPVLNEKELISSALTSLLGTVSCLESKNWEIVVSDAGSTDGSAELVRKFCEQNKWKSVLGRIVDPSVGKTVKLGLDEATGELILIMPIDTNLEVSGFKELWQAALKNKEICGGFYKSYEPSGPLLQAYQWIQNNIRSRFLKHLVWTNGLFFPRALLQETRFPIMGFLEDVLLSDFLRKRVHWKMLRGPLWVSSRRYNSRGTLRRIFINLAIMSLFRLGIVGPAKLKTFYRS